MGSPEELARVVLDSATLLEALASIEHERWSHWQQHLHEQCLPGPNDSLIIPRELVHRWSAQMTTSYDELTEEEKESDREQVRRYLPSIATAIRNAE